MDPSVATNRKPFNKESGKDITTELESYSEAVRSRDDKSWKSYDYFKSMQDDDSSANVFYRMKTTTKNNTSTVMQDTSEKRTEGNETHRLESRITVVNT